MKSGELIKNLPNAPGVYFFKDKKGKIIYVGKANNLRARVKQYFATRELDERSSRRMTVKAKNQHPKIKALVSETAEIEWQKCESGIDALIQEARLIKKHLPKYNVLLRDDKNYFFVGITREDYPCIFLTHQPVKNQNAKIKMQNDNSKIKIEYLGPFTGGKALKETLKLLRRVFPFRYCRRMPKRPANMRELKRDFAPYAIPRTKAEVRRNIRAVVNTLSGKKQSILEGLQRQMLKAARAEKFDLAEKYKNQAEYMRNIFAHRRFLEESPVGGRSSRDWPKIQEQLSEYLNVKQINRVECYDISNIGGQYAVGSMVVFIDGLPDKSQYRKFKIKYSDAKPNDPKMMAEILARRIKHKEWPTPDLIIVDGGITQLNAAQTILPKNQPVISLAKKEEEIYAPNRPPIHAVQLGNETKLFLQHIRDEAHRFAISYHRNLRGKTLRK